MRCHVHRDREAVGVLGASRSVLVGRAWLLIVAGAATIFAGDVLDAVLARGPLGGVCILFGVALLLVSRRMPTAGDDADMANAASTHDGARAP